MGEYQHLKGIKGLKSSTVARLHSESHPHTPSQNKQSQEQQHYLSKSNINLFTHPSTPCTSKTSLLPSRQ
ncbi:hypothetical protein BJX64DRAFT_260323 [Aspergillus heterothallicus]